MKSFIVISLVVLFKSLGDVCLSHAMREIGEMNPMHPLAMAAVGLRMIANPWLDLATTLLCMYSVLSLSALSWLDLSYMLPLTAFNYVLTSLFAAQLLHEQITATRWLGTLTIASGVLFISLSDRAKTQQLELKPSLRHSIQCQDEDREHKG